MSLEIAPTSSTDPVPTAGDADPHVANPGVACNPQRTFLPPNPNRDH